MAVDAISKYFMPTGSYNPKGANTVREAARDIWRSSGWNSGSASSSSVGAASSSLNRSLFDNLSSIRESAARLRGAVSSMASLSRFSSNISRAAESSDEKVLSASVAKGAAVSEYTRTDVVVGRLASGQSNTSAELKADESSFGESFSLRIADSKGQARSFSVKLSQSDDNKSAMQAMANSINNAGAGVRATVVEDKENSTVSLRLDATGTGENNGRFTVSDESPAGLGRVDKEAANAAYSINGREFTSQSNDVSIMDGVSARLAGTGSTSVSYSRDFDDAVSSVKSFLDEYNRLKELSGNSPELKSRFEALEMSFRRDLAYAGIGRDTQGNLAVTDEDRLKESIQSGSFARNFQGFGSLGGRIDEVASGAYSTAYESAVKDNISALAKEQQRQNSDFMASVFRAANVQSGLFLNLLV